MKKNTYKLNRSYNHVETKRRFNIRSDIVLQRYGATVSLRIST